MRNDRVGPRALVVFYSKNGHTRKVALAMARRIGADIEELADAKNRDGLMGSIRTGIDALLRRPATLKKVTKDPRAYDLVIVGTPTSNGALSAPIRAYVASQKGRFRNVAFFLTHNGNATGQAFFEMEEILGGDKPRALLALRDSEIEARAYARKIDLFLDAAGVVLSPAGGESRPTRRSHLHVHA